MKIQKIDINLPMYDLLREVESMKNEAYKAMGKKVIEDLDDGLITHISDYKEHEEQKDEYNMEFGDNN